MSLNKAIKYGKEHRQEYLDSKAIDRSCRNHGGCEWCLGNRMIRTSKEKERADMEEKMYLERTGEDVYDEYAGRYREFYYNGEEYAAISRDIFDDDGYPCYRVKAISKFDSLCAEDNEIPIYEAVFYVKERFTYVDDCGCSNMLDLGRFDEDDEICDMEDASSVELTGRYLKICA